jgi:hypothetical protein
MKSAILGALVGLGFVLAAGAVADQRGDMVAPSVKPPALSSSELIVVPTAALRDNAQVQVLTVVDPKQRVMGVYHIDMATGRIALKSVRNLQWDLQINDLNTDNPLPQQIRSMLEQK